MLQAVAAPRRGDHGGICPSKIEINAAAANALVASLHRLEHFQQRVWYVLQNKRGFKILLSILSINLAIVQIDVLSLLLKKKTLKGVIGRICFKMDFQ